MAVYEEDIALWSDALQKHSWDPDAGYFSYVLHDDQGQATGILRHESGANFNLGQDGVMPLLAGICTPAQEQTLLGHLQSPAAALVAHRLVHRGPDRALLPP